MKSMADALHDLGDPVSDRVLVLNVLRGLSSTYDHLKGWIARQRPFPTFLQVWDDLALEEITRDLASGSSSPTPSALVAAPPTSSAAPATSLLGAAPAGQTGGGGAWTSPARGTWWWWWHWWPCFWGYRYRWGPSGRADSAGSGSDSRFCPCPWRYALAILQQPMVRAHLDVAVPGSGRGPRPQLQPAAMFTGAAPLSAPYWTPPAQPSQQPTWLGGETRPLWRSPLAPWD